MGVMTANVLAKGETSIGFQWIHIELDFPGMSFSAQISNLPDNDRYER